MENHCICITKQQVEIVNTKQQYIPILRRFVAEHGPKYGIARLGIFGSVARGTQTPKSDLDILVEFERPIGIEFIDLSEMLEKELKKKVDVVSFKGIREKYF